MKLKLKRDLWIVASIILLLAVMKFLAFTGFVVLLPDVNEDTYMNDGAPATNYGTSTNLIIGTEVAGTNNTAILKLNLTNIPSGSTILSANLSLYSNIVVTATNVTIYRITEDWNETTATWNYPNNQNTNWTSSGGTYNSNVITSQLISSDSRYYNFTITNLVQELVNGTYSNYGILLRASSAHYGQAGKYVYLVSNDAASNKPILEIVYSSNVNPSISSIYTNKNTSETNDLITFNAVWSDTENNPSQMFVCNSSSINLTGCNGLTFCNTSRSQVNPASCNYNVSESNPYNVTYHIGMCDEFNCSTTVLNSTFLANHYPNISVELPNGGEQINQNDGNYAIRFNLSDSDNNTLTFKIYHSTSIGGKTSNITDYLNSTSYCNDSDGTTATYNNCTYSWNTTGLGLRNIYLNIYVNDTRVESYNSSNNKFNVTTVTDNTNPLIENESITGNLTSGTYGIIRALITEDNPSIIYASVNNSGTFTNHTMTLSDNSYYNASFEAGNNGTYYYKVYAEDAYNNLNDTRAWIQFNVSKPNATGLLSLNPGKALPSSLIMITGKINASHDLKGIYAYLNINASFILLSETPRNQSMGNISRGNESSINWFAFTPLTEANYSLNATYTEKYGNQYPGNNTYVLVTSNYGSGLVLSSDFGGAYYPDGFLKGYARVEDSSGNGINNANVNVSLYYPNNTLYAEWENMTNAGSGYYNYTKNLTNLPSGTYRALIRADYNNVISIIQSSFSILEDSINVKINSNEEILAGSRYNAEILVKDSKGKLIDVDDVRLSLYDPLGNAVVENVAYSTKVGIGIYNYSYATSASQTQGHWLLIANVSYNNNYYEDRQYWRLTGGPFDVRGITITDSSVNTLGISAILENTGGNNQDMTVVWNLTKQSDDSVLDSGAETVMVNANSQRTYSFNPETSFIGSVKITIIGYYSGTESAGAYEIFTTTAESITPSAPGAGAGAGGGITAKPVEEIKGKEVPIDVLKYEKRVKTDAGKSTFIDIVIKNNADSNQNVSLILSSLSENWYSINPESIYLKPGEIGKISILFNLPENIESGVYNFAYILSGKDYNIQLDASLEVRSVKESLLSEIESLNEEINNLDYSAYDAENKGINVERIKALIGLNKDKLKFTEGLADDGYYDEARKNIDDIKKNIDNIKEEFRKLGIPVIAKPAGIRWLLQYWVWIVTWLMMLLLVISVLLVYRKLESNKEIKIVKERANELNKEEINKRIDNVNKKLDVLDNELERNLLNKNVYDERKKAILDELKRIRRDIESKKKNEIFDNAVNVAKILKKKGYNVEEIKQKFKERGWNEEQINNIVNSI